MGFIHGFWGITLRASSCLISKFFTNMSPTPWNPCSDTACDVDQDPGCIGGIVYTKYSFGSQRCFFEYLCAVTNLPGGSHVDSNLRFTVSNKWQLRLTSALHTYMYIHIHTGVHTWLRMWRHTHIEGDLVKAARGKKGLFWLTLKKGHSLSWCMSYGVFVTAWVCHLREGMSTKAGGQVVTLHQRADVKCSINLKAHSKWPSVFLQQSSTT